MQTTANYGLKKPEGTDVVNIDDFNYNADAIDAELKKTKDKEIDYGTASGTNTYTATITGTSLLEGRSYKVKFTNANTGASTLNINGTGAKSIVKSNGSALSSGNIKAGQILHLVYTGTVFQLLGEGGEYGTAIAADVLEGKTIGTDTGLVPGTMVDRGTVNYTPGTANQTIAAGKHTGNGVVYGDADLVSANIKSGANIFGVAGATNVIDTAEATSPAAVSHIRSGKIAFANGAKLTGTLAVQATAAQTITPGTANIVKAAGIYDGAITIAGDADLVSANIKAGASIFGVAGKTQVVDTTESTAAATAAQIRSGRIAYVNGAKVTGSSPVQATAAQTVTPGTANIVKAAGIYDGAITIAGDADLIPSNIADGVNVFGVVGTVKRKLDIETFYKSMASKYYTPVAFNERDGKVWVRDSNYEEGKIYGFNSSGTLVTTVSCAGYPTAVPIDVSNSYILWAVNTLGILTNKSGTVLKTSNSVGTIMACISEEQDRIYCASNNEHMMRYGISSMSTEYGHDYDVFKYNWPVAFMPTTNGCFAIVSSRNEYSKNTLYYFTPNSGYTFPVQNNLWYGHLKLLTRAFV